MRVGDAIQAKVTAFRVFKIDGVDARLVSVHCHRHDADVAFRLNEVSVNVSYAERLLTMTTQPG